MCHTSKTAGTSEFAWLSEPLAYTYRVIFWYSSMSFLHLRYFILWYYTIVLLSIVCWLTCRRVPIEWINKQYSRGYETLFPPAWYLWYVWDNNAPIYSHSEQFKSKGMIIIIVYLQIVSDMNEFVSQQLVDKNDALLHSISMISNQNIIETT